jgi:hypothetical protein
VLEQRSDAALRGAARSLNLSTRGERKSARVEPNRSEPLVPRHELLVASHEPIANSHKLSEFALELHSARGAGEANMGQREELVTTHIEHGGRQ